MTPRKGRAVLSGLSILCMLTSIATNLAALWTGDLRWSITALTLIVLGLWALASSVIVRQADAS